MAPLKWMGFVCALALGGQVTPAPAEVMLPEVPRPDFVADGVAGLDPLWLAASQVQAQPVQSKSYKLLPPMRGLYHSAFPAFGPAEDTVTTRHIDDFARNVSGKDLTWAYFSDNWFRGIRFPRKHVDVILSRGVVPFVRIMPRSNWEACADRKYSLSKIIRGNFDKQLRRYAQEVRKVPGPLIMEFGTEVNGDWFPWSGACNGGGKRTGYGSPRLADGPERFRDAYRHIINIFRSEGVQNVTWVFHVNASSAPNAGWNTHAAYYPGDDYIDWIGVSVYGAQTPAVLRNWNPHFREVMDYTYPAIASISRSRPIAVLEFGVVENKHKPAWIRAALADLKSGRYPRIKAVSWWHSNWRNADGSWSYMKIDSSAESLRAYRESVADPAFVTRARFGR